MGERRRQEVGDSVQRATEERGEWEEDRWRRRDILEVGEGGCTRKELGKTHLT